MGWIQRVFRRTRLEHDLDKELRYHVERRVADLVAEGMDAQEAARRARLEFGGNDAIKEECRDARGTRWLEDFIQDLRYAFRTMAANRLFTTLAVVSLALGIGASTAIYSLMESILLRSLPVKDPEALVVINWRTQKNFSWDTSVVYSISGSIHDDPESGSTAVIVPYPAFELFQKHDAVFSSVFAFRNAGRLNLSVKGQADTASGQYVTGAYFHGLGLPPAAGRLLIPDDDRAGAPPVAVVSHALSQVRFGGAENAAGQSILINNVAFTIVGVAPPEFFGVSPGESPEIYLPLHAIFLLDTERSSRFSDPNYYWLQTMARRRPDVTLSQAQAALAEPFHQWVQSTATNEKERADLPALMLKEGASGLDELRRQYSKPLYILLTLVGFILAIACANISNLLLARATARRREMAVRLSMGAGRMRVIRQLLTESVVLASLGGAVGVLLAIWGVRLLTLLLENSRENVTLRAELNWSVLAVTAGLTLLTGVLFGLAPAIQSTKVDVIPALKEVRTGKTRSRRRWLNLSHGLVVSQIALSLLMLVAAGLFLRTLSNLQSVELGFNRENLLLFQLNARQAGHTGGEIASFYAGLQDRFRAIPGVRSASLSDDALIVAGSGMPIVPVGGKADRAARYLNVGPEYFTTMQIPLLAGRAIEERDGPNSPMVALVSERFAQKSFSGENPVGRRLLVGGKNKSNVEIVGMVKEARYGGLKRDVPPVVYFSYPQLPDRLEQMTYVLRTSGDPLNYVSAVREIVHQADARVPVADIKTQAAQIDETIGQEIAFAKLCAAFAILALVIAGVGLYGTVSYNVARRTGEIGIRMALGAQRASVVRIVMGEVFVLTVIGLAIGVPVAWSASSVVKAFLFRMEPTDLTAFIAAVATMLGAALIAAFLPARKASRIDPITALRHE